MKRGECGKAESRRAVSLAFALSLEMAQSPAEPRSKKHRQDKATATSSLVPDSPTASPEPSKKKRKLTEEGDAVSLSAEDVSEQAGTSAEGAVAEKELSKADKGKAKKRRKEEQRALVS